MKILVAGCGYVGIALAQELASAGHAVAGLRRSEGVLPDAITPIVADLTDADAVRSGLADRSFDGIVYCAAADKRDPETYRRAYVEGLTTLLSVVSAPRTIFTSSTAVYGQRAGEIVDETSETVPTGFNGQIMLEAEAVARDAGAVVLRLGGIYGPTRTRMIDRVRVGEARRPLQPVYLNHIHRDDCAGVIAHLLAMSAPESTYAGVDDEPCDIGEIYAWLADQLGVAPPAPADAPPESVGKRIRNAKLRATGYRFRFPSFREGYTSMLA